MKLRLKSPSFRLTGMLLVTSLAHSCANARASGTGPGEKGSVEAWDWCMQETVKAQVWTGAEPGSAVQAAYKDCRPEFKAVLQSLQDGPKRAGLRHKAAADSAMLMDFAKKMKKLGNPNTQP